MKLNQLKAHEDYIMFDGKNSYLITYLGVRDDTSDRLHKVLLKSGSKYSKKGQKWLLSESEPVTFAEPNKFLLTFLGL